jgi:hypothetical protein
LWTSNPTNSGVDLAMADFREHSAAALQRCGSGQQANPRDNRRSACCGSHTV